MFPCAVIAVTILQIRDACIPTSPDNPAYFGNIRFKGILVDGPALHCRAIVVYGLWGIEEQVGNLRALLYSQADERIDSELCRKSVILGGYLLAGQQQGIQFLYESRVEVEKCLVKLVQENSRILF